MSDFIGTGWLFPFSVEPTGTVAMASGTAKLEQAMRLILETYPGERPMRPRFGSTLRDYVFGGAGVHQTAEIADVVKDAIEQWEPRVDVAEVDVYPDAERPGLLFIDIRYVVPGTNSPRNLVFPFYTIPEHEEGEY
ncbi:GPW/gp25 family protein [Streptacidiphilus sp. PB12-B1b]|uniref:GPW/gp25 family protein n=1 Tax=Streptacidiphilus sp. PB12-B1b TaxID=2705012 RepID=UPI0015FBC6F8|nr:GPW/gp25 family protein [Streptacidiphilus sp. PB12-B1b]QMU78010.1 GPW/gp25 family protein [Streptacidiphilus sp. PB12-B1b]